MYLTIEHKECVVEEDGKDFKTCIPKNFEIKNPLRKNLEVLNENFNLVQLWTLPISQYASGRVVLLPQMSKTLSLCSF